MLKNVLRGGYQILRGEHQFSRIVHQILRGELLRDQLEHDTRHIYGTKTNYGRGMKGAANALSVHCNPAKKMLQLYWLGILRNAC
jgi:hypothetical protein